MLAFLLVLIALSLGVISVPARTEPAQDRLPPNYEPKHKGGVDLATGLYVREDEDLVVEGIPPLLLRRTYLAGYRTSKQFGIGTTHNGEIYLHGDFQKISLILAKGARIAFERTSTGPLLNAIYEHRSGSDEWRGAQLRFTLFGWTLKRRDSSELMFQGCGPVARTVCSIIRSRGPYGETIDYRRDLSGRLARMEAGSRWIAFDYDSSNRITRAHTTSGRSVTYEYDGAGRLSRVKPNEGRGHRYTYTDRDELATIEDPETTIENYYDPNGRVIRQVNHYPDDPEALTFHFSYRLTGDAVVQTEVARSDDRWTRYTFSETRDVVLEVWGTGPQQLGTFKYERDPQTRAVSALTIICPVRNGLPVQHKRSVSDGDLMGTKVDLVQACFSQKP